MMVEEDEDESPHVNTDETDEEAQDTCPAFDDDCKGTSVHILTLSPLLSPINSYSTLCICTSTPTPVPIQRSMTIYLQ
jgi:hypothetical protein